MRQNQQLVLSRAQAVKDLLDMPRNFCQVTELLVQKLELHSHRPRRGLYYERNVHFLLDFLLDLDQVELTVELPGIVAAGQGPQLADELIGLLLGDASGALHCIGQ